MRVSSIRGARRKLFGPQASLIALLALGATPALAQDAPQTGQASTQTETIQVTGTRIRNTEIGKSVV